MGKRAVSWDNKADYIALFILNAAEMILELVASRLMSPYFGNSNFVWTAIIGIILLAASLGNMIGGKLAARKNPRYWTGIMLLAAAIYIAITPLIDAPILQTIKDGGMGTQFSAVLGSIIFFLIPSTLLGVITPIIMKERIGDGEDKAKESGRITAIIAIGSLVGTFIGGFWLIPALGTKMIFAILGVIIVFTTVLIRPLQELGKSKMRMAFLAAFIFAMIVSFVSVFCVVKADDASENNSERVNVSIDTEYGRIIVEDSEQDGEPVRYYKQSGAYSSATYLNEDKKYDLVFEYLKKYDEAFKFTDVKNTAMIGGAAYQYPKYFIANFPDKRMDVVEIDPMSTEIAKQYFFLDDLVNEYGEERLGLYNEDGRLFLADRKKQYDVVFNDAFSGAIPVGTLATVEAAKIIKSSLKPGGVYLSNVLGAVSGTKSRFLKAEVKTLRKVFKHVYVMSVFKNVKKDDYTSWMVIATNNDKHKPDNLIEPEIKDSDIVLTDDYCPIDNLVSTDYYD